MRDRLCVSLWAPASTDIQQSKQTVGHSCTIRRTLLQTILVFPSEHVTEKAGTEVNWHAVTVLHVGRLQLECYPPTLPHTRNIDIIEANASHTTQKNSTAISFYRKKFLASDLAANDPYNTSQEDRNSVTGRLGGLGTNRTPQQWSFNKHRYVAGVLDLPVWPAPVSIRWMWYSSGVSQGGVVQYPTYK